MSSHPTTTNPLLEAARTIFEATSAAWADGDADSFVTWYTETATVALPGRLLTGSADIHTAMTAAFAGPLAGTERVHEIRQARAAGADTAVVITESATTSPGAPTRTEDRESGTWVLVRHDGTWLIEAYHSCQA
ncbi:SgcJ/EcaC family oxidoreductase [Nocardia spumae]|uniref:SgcJ/EcaC family oxidoreductase n=1 Tax=Nocardia spumae TaxID=2887190 RepID=UPI001D15929B|nr:SgcJ/EcaC family oxidoreductase [Nocardia spumae]